MVQSDWAVVELVVDCWSRAGCSGVERVREQLSIAPAAYWLPGDIAYGHNLLILPDFRAAFVSELLGLAFPHQIRPLQPRNLPKALAISWHLLAPTHHRPFSVLHNDKFILRYFWPYTLTQLCLNAQQLQFLSPQESQELLFL